MSSSLLAGELAFRLFLIGFFILPDFSDPPESFAAGNQERRFVLLEHFDQFLFEGLRIFRGVHCAHIWIPIACASFSNEIREEGL
jgi:hypothetical protein